MSPGCQPLLPTVNLHPNELFNGSWVSSVFLPFYSHESKLEIDKFWMLASLYLGQINILPSL